ncbi:MAG: ImmA/IrrE family metallo-endopeptidase, partial [Acutalibacteraceae bacterium]
DVKKVKKIETICNAVAAEILVPSAIFKDKWNFNNKQTNDKEKIINTLSGYFKCGTTVIARKALDDGLINSALYNKISETAIKYYNENKKAKKNGGDYYRTAASRIDHRFFNMLAGSLNEGKTLYSDAFRLTHTNRSTFARLVEQVGGIRE